MSLEELQLLLRSHQQSMESNAAAMDVSMNLYMAREQKIILMTLTYTPRLTNNLYSFLQPFTFSLPLNEWNFTEMDPNLKSVSLPSFVNNQLHNGSKSDIFQIDNCMIKYPLYGLFICAFAGAG